MRIKYLEEHGSKEFITNRPDNAIFYRWAEKSEKIADPITITVQIEIDKTKYEKLQNKYQKHLSNRIFSYLGFK